jgi:tetratricopeptide (TPR) repeat protein
MRKLPIALVLLAAAAAAVALAVWAFDRPEWTSDSAAARAEFEQGLSDEARFYHLEAVDHYERALQLDPDFVMPEVRLVVLLRGMDSARVGELVEDLRSRDLAEVTPRERLLVDYLLAHVDRKPEEAAARVEDYLTHHPDDPYAIELSCGQKWGRQAWSEAETCYRRLIQVDPNRVEAQNRLGYIAMAQGRFAEAEEQFDIYRYIAPDQPNPHDSLGELLLLVGRWDEAESELEEALAIKPDFCASRRNLIQLELLRGDFDAAHERLAEARRAEGCPEKALDRDACRIEAWRAFVASDAAGTWQAAMDPSCGEGFDDSTTLAYQVALEAGQDEEAAAIEARLAKLAEEYGKDEPSFRALEAHLRGLRLRIEGHPEQAIEPLTEADRLLTYWGGGQGYLKLGNRLELWRALTAAGRQAEADALIAELEKVNPPLIERWAHRPSG